MLNSNTYLGLDISDLSIKAVQFKISSTHPEVISYGSIELPTGLIVEGEIKNPQELTKSVHSLFTAIKGEKIKTKNVSCSLPEEKSFVRLVSLPLMSDKELKEAIKWAAETEIPMKLDEIYLGWEVIEKHEGGENAHIDVLLVASPKNIVDSYVDFLKSLNLTPVLMEIESSLIVKSVIPLITETKNKKYPDVSKDSILIVDIGAHRTSFMIFNGKSLSFTSTTEISGNTLSEVLVKDFNIDAQQAEKTKMEFGLDKEEQQGEIYNSLAPPLKSLVDEIGKVVDYYKEHHIENEQLNISKVIVCGGGALLKGLTSYLQTSLKLSVELGNPWVNFKNIDVTKKNKLPIIPKEVSLSYTTTIGLVLSIKKEYY